MPRAFAWGFPSKETMAGYINRFSQICARLTGIIVIVLAICLIGSLLISIFFRYVIGQALSWPEEISLILFTWLVLLAGSLGVRQDFHVRLTIVVSRFPTPVQHILDRLVVLAIGIFGAILLYSGYDLVKRTAEHLTPTLRLPLDWLNYSAPVCGTLILLHAVSKLLTGREES